MQVTVGKYIQWIDAIFYLELLLILQVEIPFSIVFQGKN